MTKAFERVRMYAFLQDSCEITQVVSNMYDSDKIPFASFADLETGTTPVLRLS